MGPGKCNCEEKILDYMINRADWQLFFSSSPESVYHHSVRDLYKKGLGTSVVGGAYIYVFIKSRANFKAST
jgi:hypothetical protein